MTTEEPEEKPSAGDRQQRLDEGDAAPAATLVEKGRVRRVSRSVAKFLALSGMVLPLVVVKYAVFGTLLSLVPVNCHPIPGDPVIGFSTSENLVIVHKKSCPVAESVAMVLPWKEFLRVMTVLWESSPYLSKAYFLATFTAHSLASAPELPKKTFFMPVRSHSICASCAQG